MRSAIQNLYKGKVFIMKKRILRTLALSLTVVMLVFSFTACGGKKTETKGDIIILYTNDVHCGIDKNIGYAGLSAYKKSVMARTDYVTLVDCGDSVQGEAIGTISRGEYIVDIMNEVGYDIAIPGNHEFDYGMTQFSALVRKINADYLCCNLTYTGKGENPVSDVKPYVIKEYGNTSVAFIGALTPDAITSSTPAYFMENDEFVFDLHSKSVDDFCSTVQKNVDECVSKGADYVVILAHLGDEESASGINSTVLAENTNGINVILDAHSHSTVPSRILKNKDGGEVIVSSTGTKLAAIGQLVITADGFISTGLITDYGEKDKDVEAYIENINSEFSAELGKVVAKSNITLSVSDADGVRMVRSREVPLGNLCADAYRAVSGADIAFVNGGGIRADLPEGDITYNDIISIHPFGNMLSMVEATGAQILDALEMASRYTESEYKDDSGAKGENGGFLQVSGLKYTIDTSIPSSVETDDKGMFAGVSGARRVCDVEVLTDGEYVPINPEKTYKLASHDYMLFNCGDGINMFTEDEVLIDRGMLDNQVLITFLTKEFEGNIAEVYSAPAGRITVK